MQKQSKKNWKQKLAELKDIATGKKPIESIAESHKPRTVFVYEQDNGAYNVDGQLMNEEEFQAWGELKDKPGGKIHQILIFRRQKGNNPIIEEEETHYPNGIVWHESKEYHLKEKEYHNSESLLCSNDTEEELKQLEETTDPEPKPLETELFAIPVRKNSGRLSDYGITWGSICET